MNLQYLRGPLVTVLVALLPIVLWLVLAPETIEFNSDSQKYDAIGRMAALAGLSLLAWNIIISARIPLLERLFLGLDRAYRAHRIIGGTVLVLILMHVMSMTAKYSSLSLATGFDFLISTKDIALMVGKLALGILIILIPLSLYVTIKHEWFISVQRVLGAVIFLGGFHALFVGGSDLTDNLFLLIYLSILCGLAILLYVYRSIFHRSLKPKLSYGVESVEFANGVTKIWMKPLGKPLAFYAGQFAFFRFDSEAISNEVHPFSLSSGSDDPKLRISAKAIGDFTQEMSMLKRGDKAVVEGPYGQFSFTKPPGKKQIWIAGGIGVTPFVSMAHSLPSGYAVILYYCVNKPEQAVFRSELEKLSSKKRSFKLEIVTSKDPQLTGAELASKHAEEYLLCAPPPMMHKLEKSLKGAGVSKNNIHFEEFRLK